MLSEDYGHVDADCLHHRTFDGEGQSTTACARRLRRRLRAGVRSIICLVCNRGQLVQSVPVDGLEDSLSHPANTVLLASLKRQAVVPTDTQVSPWDIDGFELHTHPDLIERLRELGEGGERDVTAVYGIAVLVRPIGRPFAIAVGTRTLLLGLSEQPDDVVVSEMPAWFSAAGWVGVNAWQSELPSADGTERLRRWVRRAFDDC